MPSQLVVFDLDETITRHDTLLPYAWGFLIRRRPWRIPLLSAVLPSVVEFLLGRVDEGRVKESFIKATLGGALAHMHAQDILHLDVKPSNVIVTHGRPVLFDLGTARRRSEWSRPTREGTQPYMAPEQCLGLPVSPATDLEQAGSVILRGETNIQWLKEHGVSIKAIRAANDLKTDKIKVGEKLKLPEKAAPAADTTAPAPAPAPAPMAPAPSAPAPTPGTAH